MSENADRTDTDVSVNTTGHVLRELRDDMRWGQERLWASSHLDPLVAHIDTLTAQLAEARQQRDALIEDRARFPDRPDHIGRLIQWHIDNLKSRAAQSDDLARQFHFERDTLAAIVEQIKALPKYASNDTGTYRVDSGGFILARDLNKILFPPGEDV